MSDWQPIETAPKDGTEILVAFWSDDDWTVGKAKWGRAPGDDFDAWMELDAYGSAVVTGLEIYFEDPMGQRQVVYSHLPDACYWTPLPAPPKTEG